MKSSAPVLLILMTLFALPLSGQNTGPVKKAFVKTFTSARAADMQLYFDGFVNVDLPGSTGLFTAVRSQSQLQDFFNKHPVSGFRMQEEGFTGKKYFLIGSFESRQKHWNVYFLLVPKDGRYCIQQMEIEATD